MDQKSGWNEYFKKTNIWFDKKLIIHIYILIYKAACVCVSVSTQPFSPGD